MHGALHIKSEVSIWDSPNSPSKIFSNCIFFYRPALTDFQLRGEESPFYKYWVIFDGFNFSCRASDKWTVLYIYKFWNMAYTAMICLYLVLSFALLEILFLTWQKLKTNSCACVFIAYIMHIMAMYILNTDW